VFGDPEAGSHRAGVSVVSTLVVIGVAAFIVVNAPGWPRIQGYFFNPGIFAKSFPFIFSAFWLNVQLFLLAEVLTLGLALLLAIMRSLPGPVFAPLRIVAIAYTDLFRGIPGILVIFMLGLGMPGLRLEGVPRDPFFWGLIALTLIYSAYVSEVYRAGIDSVHPSQDAAARSLGLTRFQSLRYVVLPQAVRRVIPPLLNDFIGLQKDSALVAFLGPIESFRRAQIDSAGTFNATPYVVTALLFLIITVPMARFVDWLIARDRRRYLAGAG
jgi:polar amino acid transport system permease protein